MTAYPAEAETERDRIAGALSAYRNRENWYAFFGTAPLLKS